MQNSNISTHEYVGLGMAVALHVGLLAVLVMSPDETTLNRADTPQSITVSLAEDVGLQASTPVPVAEARASMGPELSDIPAPSISDTAPLSRPDIAPPQRLTRLREVERTPTPATRRETTPSSRSSDTPARRQPAKKESSPRSTSSSSRSSGASKEFSQAFDGSGSSATSTDTRTPASGISGAAKLSLQQSIARQLKPHWDAPEGADAEKLVTLVSFRLNENGSVAGTPQCKPTQGVTPSNQAQASTHCRYAIRAIKAAAPFNLPDRFYNAWKRVPDVRFSGDF